MNEQNTLKLLTSEDPSHSRVDKLLISPTLPDVLLSSSSTISLVTGNTRGG